MLQQDWIPCQLALRTFPPNSPCSSYVSISTWTFRRLKEESEEKHDSSVRHSTLTMYVLIKDNGELGYQQLLPLVVDPELDSQFNFSSSSIPSSPTSKAPPSPALPKSPSTPSSSTTPFSFSSMMSSSSPSSKYSPSRSSPFFSSSGSKQLSGAISLFLPSSLFNHFLSPSSPLATPSSLPANVRLLSDVRISPWNRVLLYPSKDTSKVISLSLHLSSRFPSSTLIKAIIRGELLQFGGDRDKDKSVPGREALHSFSPVGTGLLGKEGRLRIQTTKGTFYFLYRCEGKGRSWGQVDSSTDVVLLPNEFPPVIVRDRKKPSEPLQYEYLEDKVEYLMDQTTLSSLRRYITVPRALNPWHIFDSLLRSYFSLCFSTKKTRRKEPPTLASSSILLHGPSGTGKTHFANAISASLGLERIVVWPGEIASLYIGDKPKAVSYFFQLARRAAPCVLIFEELDALFPSEEGGEGLDNFIREMTLVKEDAEDEGRRRKMLLVGVVRSTSWLNISLVKRFQSSISVEFASPLDRVLMLRYYLESNRLKLEDETCLQEVANRSHGYLPVDLFGLCREAQFTAEQRRFQEEGKPGRREEREEEELLRLTLEDFEVSMKRLRPSVSNISISVPKVRWEDVGGHEHIKNLLKESVVWVYEHKKDYLRLGIEPPKGVLLYGPPGTGKTLLAKAVASESKANFISIKISDIVTAEVGESEKLLASVFQKAKLYSPTVLFFDEIQAIFGSRDSSGGHAQKMISQLLLELDSLAGIDVILIAATNCPEAIDDSFFRPGRLDRLIYIPPPSVIERESILAIYTSEMKLDNDISLSQLAAETIYFTGADLRNLCRQASLQTLQRLYNTDRSHFSQFITGPDDPVSSSSSSSTALSAFSALRVSMEDFRTALKKLQPSVSPLSLVKFETWQVNNRSRTLRPE